MDQILHTSVQEELAALGPPPTTAPKVGREILNFVIEQKKTQKGSLGSCWRVTADRVGEGWYRAFGKELLAGQADEERRVFEAIAGSRWGDMPNEWKKVPVPLQKRGVPGALAYLQVAKVVEKAAVWRDIDPGGPMQLWFPGWGHSLIFYRYVLNERGAVVAMVLADQWEHFVMLRRHNQSKTVIGAKFLSQAAAPSTSLPVKSAVR
jgi:hypothetical protein